MGFLAMESHITTQTVFDDHMYPQVDGVFGERSASIYRGLTVCPLDNLGTAREAVPIGASLYAGALDSIFPDVTA